MVECMAQVSGVLGFISAGLTSEDGYLYLFAGVDKVRFKRQVIPGDQLIIRSKITMQKQGILSLTVRFTLSISSPSALRLWLLAKRNNLSKLARTTFIIPLN